MYYFHGKQIWKLKTRMGKRLCKSLVGEHTGFSSTMGRNGRNEIWSCAYMLLLRLAFTTSRYVEPWQCNSRALGGTSLLTTWKLTVDNRFKSLWTASVACISLFIDMSRNIRYFHEEVLLLILWTRHLQSLATIYNIVLLSSLVSQISRGLR